MAPPSDPIVISGEISRAESNAAFDWYAAMLRRRAQVSWIERVGMTVLVVGIVVLGVPLAVFVIRPSDIALVGMIAAVFGFVVAIVFARFANARFLQRTRELRTSNLGLSTYTFSPKGYGVALASGISSLTPWTAVKRIDIAPEFFMFWHDGYFAQTFPRSVVGGPDRDAELRAAIRNWTPHAISTL